MKKLIFGFFSTVMIAGMSFGQSNIEFSDYGFYHNQGLELYNSQYSLKNESSIDSALEHMLKVLEEKFPSQFKNVDISEIKMLFKGYTIKSFDVVKIWNNRKVVMYQGKSISHTVGNYVDAALSGKYSYSENTKIINDMLKLESLSENDKNALTAFKSILANSHEYWYPGDANRWPHITTRDLADAGGGLMFWESGPLAIVAGLACSSFFP